MGCTSDHAPSRGRCTFVDKQRAALSSAYRLRSNVRGARFRLLQQFGCWMASEQPVLCCWTLTMHARPSYYNYLQEKPKVHTFVVQIVQRLFVIPITHKADVLYLLSRKKAVSSRGFQAVRGLRLRSLAVPAQSLKNLGLKTP